jgi:lysophospholipase L1-like esterase
MTQALEDISNHKPDVVYIHLGVNDISENRSPAEISIDFQTCIDRILRDTPEYCVVIVSHILPCSEPTRHNKVCTTGHVISNTITTKSSSSDSNIFWKRVRQNFNTNFFQRSDSRSCNADMFSRDMVHLNERGIRVIMGNFRTVLNDVRRSQ